MVGRCIERGYRRMENELSLWIHNRYPKHWKRMFGVDQAVATAWQATAWWWSPEEDMRAIERSGSTDPEFAVPVLAKRR